MPGIPPTLSPNATDSQRLPILVTGATGHLGANLVRRLLADGEVVRVLVHPQHGREGIDRLDVEVVPADLRVPEAVSTAVKGCERIYHCGAIVSTVAGTARHRRRIFETNVWGTRHVLDAAQQHGVSRVIVTGSFSAVGHHIDDPAAPSDESLPFYPFQHAMPYERTKVLAEIECLRAAARGQDVVIATSCAILGGHDYEPSRMGRTLCDFANGKLRAYVDGGFEFVCARDIVEGHLLAMSRGRSGEKYIFSSQFATLDDLLEIFERVTGLSRPRWRLPAPLFSAFANVASPVMSRLLPNFPQRLTPGAIRLLQMCRHADTSRAQNELGFRPTSIEAAIEEAYAFHYARGAIRNPEAKAPAQPAEGTSPVDSCAA